MRFATDIHLLVLLSSACFAQTEAIPSTSKIMSTCWDPAVIGQVPAASPTSELRNIKPSHGVISIEVVVNPDGQIGNIKWIDGPEMFRKPAIAWVKGCLYIPAAAGEQPIRQRLFIKLRANPANQKLQYGFHFSPSPKFDLWCSVPEK